jgi:hypothetical protein
MPFTSGTAETPSVLMEAMNAHLTANGWIKLQGNTDLRTDSPVDARYWRVLWNETEATNDDFRELRNLEFRTTLGGANVATIPANLTSNTTPTSGDWGDVLGSDTARITADINDDPFWLQYDFGAATTVREVVIKADTDNYAPRDLRVQFSTDAITWTTMFQATGLSWVDQETKVFQFDDGHRYSEHAGLNQPRKTGSSTDTSQASELCEDVYVWQGPGYDAARRVYVAAQGLTDPANSTHWIRFYSFIDYTPGLHPSQQNGVNFRDCYLVMDQNPVDYWFYSNSIRMALVTRSGVADYTSAYAGFMAAFALPDEYPQPLFVGATSDGATLSIVQNPALSSFCDPGERRASWRDWNGTWDDVDNRDDAGGGNDDYLLVPSSSWTFPYHSGKLGQSDAFPFGHNGNNGEDGNHWLDRIVPGPAGELPVYPITVMNDPYGAVGALDGVFAIPGGNILAPLQIITINSQDYRVFPNRDRRQGHHWFVIRED